ncbi:MAG TPA: ABC transporter permease [Kineosporiaceae bacterium]|nr:ABC transporter permease [Kineosporiaceae bacterium]
MTARPQFADRSVPSAGRNAGPALRRVGALSRAELNLFRRNRTAVFSALGMPLVLVGAVSGVDVGRRTLSTTAFLVTSMLGFVLLTAVYYNLVTAYVARREDLVLKRLRVGELHDAEILAGVASPSVVVSLVQVAVVVVVGTMIGLPVPVNPLLLALGITGGIVMFVLLAAVSTAFTRTPETAQITTLPVLLACMLGSGLMVPLDVLPGAVVDVLRILPMTPVLELVRLGWLGTTGSGPEQGFLGVLGPALAPSAILTVWLVLGVISVRRWFRWDPRR